ncbi:MAG: diguanylate cyclase [Desulfobacteraceae bacterium]|uniref:diguanylate cyclase n=1 Tax=Candidatus Desulfaltia bathyphila TaxID=2841697 RepID=A0A8J6T6B4_9BACT|nr:diguanylate cyclase [Candidatus Desulfaltia bathyphila]MBL7194949.1 diguanylate cyclase [Desulfobacterales bacterium]
MDIFGLDNLSLKLLIESLKEDHLNPTINQVEWKELEKSFGHKIYPEILRLLTQMEFEPEEARMHWHNVLAHRKNLKKTLGRDAGFRVALCDYFINIHPKLKNLIFVDVDLFLQKERAALIDELTGLYNRRFFNRVLKREIEHARRYDQLFSLLMLDIDNFKEYNDIHGHQAGDKALNEFAQILKQNARLIDHTIRYGGEEFAIILPRADIKQARLCAERHLRAVETHTFSGQERLPLGNFTVTIGVATYPINAQDGLELIQKADEALYIGKQKGRNRVVISSDERRRKFRYPLHVEMLFRLRDSAEKSFDRGTTRNISQTGMLCQTDEPVEAGRMLEIVLRHPFDRSELNFIARSVRLGKNPEKNRSYFLGLSIELGSEKEEKALEALGACPRIALFQQKS